MFSAVRMGSQLTRNERRLRCSSWSGPSGLDGITTSRFSSRHQGAAIYTYTGNGNATVRGFSTNRIAKPQLYSIQPGFNLTIQ